MEKNFFEEMKSCLNKAAVEVGIQPCLLTWNELDNNFFGE